MWEDLALAERDKEALRVVASGNLGCAHSCIIIFDDDVPSAVSTEGTGVWIGGWGVIWGKGSG